MGTTISLRWLKECFLIIWLRRLKGWVEEGIMNIPTYCYHLRNETEPIVKVVPYPYYLHEYMWYTNTTETM